MRTSGFRLGSQLATDVCCVAGAALLALLFLSGADAAAGSIDFPLDDAWIHLVYARSLFQQGMLAYNPGVPEGGASSLLFAALISPLAGTLTGPGLVLAVKTVSVLGAAITAAAMARIARSLHDDPAMSWLAAAWVLLSPAFAFAALSGMEVTLASALSASAIAAFLQGRAALCGVLLGLAGLARPECGLITLAVAAVALRKSRRDALRVAWPSLPCAALWLTIDLASIGHLFPNTFYAKAQRELSTRGLQYLVQEVFLSHGTVYALCTAALAIFGARQLWKRRATMDVRLVALLAPLLPILVIALVHTLHPGVKFYMQRYFLSFTPFDAPFVALALVSLRAMAAASGSRWLRSLPVLAVALLATPPLLAQRAAYLDHCSAVVKLHTRPALELIATRPAGSVTAVEGAGASRFFGSGTIIDLVALNDHRLVHERRPGVRPCLVMLRDPDLFVVPSEYFGPLSYDYELSMFAQYHVPAWPVYGGTRARNVVAAHARPRPERLAACRALVARVTGAAP